MTDSYPYLGAYSVLITITVTRSLSSYGARSLVACHSTNPQVPLSAGESKTLKAEFRMRVLLYPAATPLGDR